PIFQYLFDMKPVGAKALQAARSAVSRQPGIDTQHRQGSSQPDGKNKPRPDRPCAAHRLGSPATSQPPAQLGAQPGPYQATQRIEQVMLAGEQGRQRDDDRCDDPQPAQPGPPIPPEKDDQQGIVNVSAREGIVLLIM